MYRDQRQAAYVRIKKKAGGEKGSRPLFLNFRLFIERVEKY